MDKDRTARYAAALQKMVRIDTISDPERGSDPGNFEELRTLLWELFPNIREGKIWGRGTLGLSDVSYGKWFRYSWKFQAMNLVLTSALLLFGLAVGY